MNRSVLGKASSLSLFLLLTIGVGLAQGADSDVQKEIELLKEGQKTIMKQLQEIKTLLQQRPSNPATPPEVNVRGMEFELGANPVKGSSSSKLILVDFTEYQCPFCGRYARETFPQIMKQYVETGKIRYAIMDMPLAMHPLAPKAAEAARCANEQGKFWEMHDQMMAKQDALANLSSYATALNLDMPKFDECLKSGKHAQGVAKDMAAASKLGVSGVPRFILASVDPRNPSKVKGIASILGAQPFPAFQKAIDEALAPPKQ